MHADLAGRRVLSQAGTRLACGHEKAPMRGLFHRVPGGEGVRLIASRGEALAAIQSAYPPSRPTCLRPLARNFDRAGGKTKKGLLAGSPRLQPAFRSLPVTRCSATLS